MFVECIPMMGALLAMRVKTVKTLRARVRPSVVSTIANDCVGFFELSRRLGKPKPTLARVGVVIRSCLMYSLWTLGAFKPQWYPRKEYVRNKIRTRSIAKQNRSNVVSYRQGASRLGFVKRAFPVTKPNKLFCAVADPYSATIRSASRKSVQFDSL